MKLRILAVLLLASMAASMAFAAETALDQADKLAGAKKFDDALRILREYDTTHPGDLEAHDRIQRILKRQGKKQVALDEYRARYEKDPSALNGYLYARLLDSPAEREAKFRDITNADPSFVWGHVGLATALLDQDRLQDGVDAATQGLAKVKDPAELFYIRSRIYRRMQDYTEMAADAREYYRLKPDPDAREFAYAYEWLEVSHAAKPEDKLRLADAWVEKYRSDMEKGEGLEGAMRFAEVSFIYAARDLQAARVHRFSGLGLKVLSAEKPAESGEDRDYYFRTKGSLLALEAWAEAKIGSPDRALRLLRDAEKAGPASEMYYFSALTRTLLHRKSDALQDALRAASYPPVFEGSRELATSLWKDVHGEDAGLEAALHNQREYFAPQRKKRVLSQEVAETFQPFEITDPDGKVLTQKDLAGKTTLVNFWAVWCPPCREELPHWNAFVAAHNNDSGLRMIAVGDEPWETITNYMKNHDYSFPVFRNEKYWDEFAVNGIPTLLVIDGSGRIRFRNTGFEEGMEYEETLLWQINQVRGQAH